MIKKSKSYCFCKFVMGVYKNNDKDLLNLFNNMTYNEKLDIIRMDFNLLWYRIHLSNSTYEAGIPFYESSIYLSKKNRFESLFLPDRGDRLIRLISDSINSDTEWEFPKGKKSRPSESDLNAAIREFEEETKLTRDQYRILWHVNPYIESYRDYGVIYKNTYFYAELIHGSYKYDYSDKNQVRELQDIQWMSKNKLSLLSNICPTSHNRLFKKVSIVTKKYKRIKKSGFTYYKKAPTRLTFLDQVTTP